VIEDLFPGITLRISSSELRLPFTKLREKIRPRRSLLRVVVAGNLLFAHLGIGLETTRSNVDVRQEQPAQKLTFTNLIKGS
jgi:hypothetical protein